MCVCVCVCVWGGGGGGGSFAANFMFIKYTCITVLQYGYIQESPNVTIIVHIIACITVKNLKIVTLLSSLRIRGREGGGWFIYALGSGMGRQFVKCISSKSALCIELNLRVLL